MCKKMSVEELKEILLQHKEALNTLSKSDIDKIVKQMRESGSLKN